MLRRTLTNTLAVAALVAAFAVPAASAQPRNPNKDVIQTAQAAGAFQTLLKAVRVADLQGTLKTTGPITVFAPNDDAFAKVPSDVLAGLLADETALRNVLLYHVASGALYANDVVGSPSIPTLLGPSISVSVLGSDVYLNGTTKVLATDITAKNGVIHVIDSVLLPPQ